MKLTLTADIVLRTAIGALLVLGNEPLKYLNTFEEDNYLVYDEHEKSSPSFCIRVGEKSQRVFDREAGQRQEPENPHWPCARQKRRRAPHAP